MTRPTAVREHGTRARYVSGPDENGTPGKPCRCEACKAANRVYAGERERARLYGRWQPWADAGPVREHVLMLRAHNIGRRRVAELAGAPEKTVSQLLHGRGKDHPPPAVIRSRLAAAILAITPTSAALAPGAREDATGTHRRCRALVAIGWPQSRLAARLGMLPPNFGSMMSTATVRAATARAVRSLYDELWDQPPPEGTHREKIAASRARNHAARHGWAPPLAWDDDEMDDPAASPAEGWQRPKRTPREDVVAEFEELAAMHPMRHCAPEQVRSDVAERMGRSRNSLDRVLERHAAARREGAAA